MDGDLPGVAVSPSQKDPPPDRLLMGAGEEVNLRGMGGLLCGN